MNAALKYRDFRLLWAGQAVSQLGSRGYGVAVMLWVLATTHAPATVGAVTTVTLGVLAAAQAPSGWLADRYDRRRVMLAADALSATASGSLAVAAAAGAFSLVHVLIAAGLLGIGWAVRGTAEHAALPRLVPADALSDAIAVNSARGYATGIAGPALAGVLFAVAPALPFAVDAASYAVAGLTTLLIRRRLRPDGPAGPADGGSWAAGVRAVRRQPFIRRTLLLATTGEVVVNGCGLVLVVRLDNTGSGSGTVGAVLAAAYGAGLVGALAVPASRRRVPADTLIAVAPLAGAAGVLALTATAPLVAAAGYAALLLARPLWQVPLTERWLALVDDEVRGRAMGAVGTVTAVATTMTPALTGALTGSLGPAATAAVMAAMLATAATLTRGSRATGKTRSTPPDLRVRKRPPVSRRVRQSLRCIDGTTPGEGTRDGDRSGRRARPAGRRAGGTGLRRGAPGDR